MMLKLSNWLFLDTYKTFLLSFNKKTYYLRKVFYQKNNMRFAIYTLEYVYCGGRHREGFPVMTSHVPKAKYRSQPIALEEIDLIYRTMLLTYYQLLQHKINSNNKFYNFI